MNVSSCALCFIVSVNGYEKMSVYDFYDSGAMKLITNG